MKAARLQPNRAPRTADQPIHRAEPVHQWEIARWGRLLAGMVTLFFTLLGLWFHSWWLLGTLCVALQLVVTAITDRCPVRNLLLRLGLREREDLFEPGGMKRVVVTATITNPNATITPPHLHFPSS